MTTAISASSYNVELRRPNGQLRTYLTPFITRINWEWNRIGGCGRCSITLGKDYRDIEFNAHDDIQIRVGTKLCYRGFVANVSPSLKINQEITLDVRGYFDLFKKLVVHNAGDTKTYTSKTIAYIVDDIADTFIIPNSSVTLGTIDTTDGSAFTIDSIDFLGTVDDALRTLAEIAGDAEYGVDEDLVFYWRTEVETISRRFFVGDNISVLERKVNWDDLVNKIYLVGGDVAGVKYKKTGQNTDSQTDYYLSETILNNSSIVTDSVAAQYLNEILLEKSIPRLSIKATIKNTNIRLEDTIPMGMVTFFDAEHDLLQDIIGEAADGGSDITIGLGSDGGSDVYVGGEYAGQVSRISYNLSATAGRFNIDIELGDTVLETSAKLKRMEMALASVTQY